MKNNSQELAALEFNQVVIADLTDCQLAIPTTTKTVKKRIFSVWVPVSERLYAPEGWMVVEGQTIGTIHGLKISPIGPSNSPFKVHPHLGPAVPISFEARSTRSLPPSLIARAKFACEFPESEPPYYAVFHQVQPRFVRVYPLTATTSLAETVKTLLLEEENFIQKNYLRLQQVPFYREQFGL